MIGKRFLQASAIAAGLTFAAGAAVAAEYGPGASDSEIKIGNTNPYSGPASAYGSIGTVISKYFDKVNAEGGINGRKINFVTLDDSYSPPKTVEQVRKLVEQEKVLFLFQTLGTPPNSAIHKYMNAKKVPQLFVATGATKWGDPANFPWTMGWQPNYQTEAAIYVKWMLDNVDNPKIAILYQNDDYGKDYLQGIHDGLGSKASLIVLEQSYEVTDPTVASQMANLKNSGANVFFNITTPKFAAQAIKIANELGWNPTHFLNNVSTSVGSVLTPAGLEASTGLISTLYTKDATDPAWDNDPGMNEWREFMAKYHPKGNVANGFNIYGYAVAQTLEHVLRQAGDNLTRANIMKEAASITDLRIKTLLPGILINTGPNDFRPIEGMQLRKFNGTTWEAFGPVVSVDTSS